MLEDINQTKAEAETKRRQAHDQLEVVKSRYYNISSQSSQAQAEGGTDSSFGACVFVPVQDHISL